jgi:inner membrane protein
VASIGHVVVGAAIAVIHHRVTSSTTTTPGHWLIAAIVFPMLALLPDADVIGFRFGVAYADNWGHRGASHSLFMAILGGACLAWPLSKLLRSAYVPTACAAIAALLSHGLLDTLTDGGLGAALFWPFEDGRFFAPWRPIPVAPIGRAFLSMRGLRCVGFELLTMGPLLVIALGWSHQQRHRHLGQ